MAEWRNGGPIGTLIDIIHAIDSPYEHQLFYSFRDEENKQLPKPDFLVLDVIKPVKTRWNSHLAAFERAVDLQGPINTWVEYHIDKWDKEQAAKAAKRRTSAKKPKQPEQPPLYIQNGGLTPYDWDVINNYIRILTPLREATLKLEARGKAGRNGAIWQII